MIFRMSDLFVHCSRYHTSERYHDVTPRVRGDRASCNTTGQPARPSLKPARSQGRLLPSKFDPAGRPRPKSLYFEDDCLQNHPPSSSTDIHTTAMRKYKSVVSLSKDNTSSTVYVKRTRPVVSAHASPVKRTPSSGTGRTARKFNRYDERALMRRLSTTFDDEDEEVRDGGGGTGNVVFMTTSDFYSYSSEDEI